MKIDEEKFYFKINIQNLAILLAPTHLGEVKPLFVALFRSLPTYSCSYAMNPHDIGSLLKQKIKRDKVSHGLIPVGVMNRLKTKFKR